MKSYFLFLLFFNLAFSQNIFSQRIFMGQLVIEKNDTLKGEIWFGMSGKLPYKTKLVFFSEDGHKVQRFKASKLLSMEVIHDLTHVLHYFERQVLDGRDHLVSETRKDEYGRQGIVSRKAAVITVHGDTIRGMYKQMPFEYILSASIPVYKVDYNPSEVIAYWISDRDKEHHFFERKRMASGASVFLEPVSKGKLSLYKIEKTNFEIVNFPISPVAATIVAPIVIYEAGEALISGEHSTESKKTNRYYLCNDELKCKRIRQIDFRKSVLPYLGDCDIFLKAYKFSYLKALVEDYNKKCGETGE